MARGNRGGQYALTATAASLTDALSLTGNLHFSKITIKNANGAANAFFHGNSDVTVTTNAHGELVANQGYTFGGDGHGYYNASDIFLIGTANAANIAYIQLEE